VLNALVTLGTFDQAALQLFQIAMTNNWQDVMYANVLSPYDVSNAHRAAMAAYFVSFFFCMVYNPYLLVHVFEICRGFSWAAPTMLSCCSNYW
jgi:hypothetical protein